MITPQNWKEIDGGSIPLLAPWLRVDEEKQLFYCEPCLAAFTQRHFVAKEPLPLDSQICKFVKKRAVIKGKLPIYNHNARKHSNLKVSSSESEIDRPRVPRESRCVTEKSHPEFFSLKSLHENGFWFVRRTKKLRKLFEKSEGLIPFANRQTSSPISGQFEQVNLDVSKMKNSLKEFFLSLEKFIKKSIRNGFVKFGSRMICPEMRSFKKMKLQRPKMLKALPNRGPQIAHRDSWNFKDFVVLYYLTDGVASTEFSTFYPCGKEVQSLDDAYVACTEWLKKPKAERAADEQGRKDFQTHLKMLKEGWDTKRFVHKKVNTGDIVIFHADTIHRGPRYETDERTSRYVLFHGFSETTFRDDEQVFEHTQWLGLYGVHSHEMRDALRRNLLNTPEFHHFVEALAPENDENKIIREIIKDLKEKAGIGISKKNKQTKKRKASELDK